MSVGIAALCRTCAGTRETRRLELLHHDGGEEHSLHVLEGLVGRAEAVFCPIDCVSHQACLAAKQMCRRLDKPFVPLRTGSGTCFLRAIDRWRAIGAPAPVAESRRPRLGWPRPIRPRSYCLATIAAVALPFFAVLLCGMLAARLRLIDDAGLIGLNAFVFWFALPALLFHKVATTPFARLTDWTLYVGYEGACVLLYFLVLAAARWVLRRTLREAAILAFAASWGNVGYMGVPLLSAAYGESAGLPAVLAVVLDTLVLQSLTILLLESGGGAGAWRPAHGRPGGGPQSSDHRGVRRCGRGRPRNRPAIAGRRLPRAFWGQLLLQGLCSRSAPRCAAERSARTRASSAAFSRPSSCCCRPWRGWVCSSFRSRRTCRHLW